MFVGNLYVAEYSNTVGKIRKLNVVTNLISLVAGGSIEQIAGSGSSLPATAVKMNNAFGVFGDLSNNRLYVSEGSTVHVISLATGLCTALTPAFSR